MSGVRLGKNRSAPHSTPVGTFTFRESVVYARIRRGLDIAGAIVLLVTLSPIFLAAAVAILSEDGRPIFFCQRRVGRFGRVFVMHKLRTMRKESCGDKMSPTSGGDPRVTRAGYWLRRTSIDELPQLVNIVRGEMSFVGPRPEMPFVVRSYEPWQHLRHLVKPGLTGFWQTTSRKTVPMHLPEATLLDLKYIEAASFHTDAIVLAKTMWGVMTAKGAY